MRVLIKPGPLTGALSAIPAKADAHRRLICAAMADKPTYISPAPGGDDIEATTACLRQLGASFIPAGPGLTVEPRRASAPTPLLDCRESGSTLRFLLPLATLLTDKAHFTGAGRLPVRPLKELIDCMEAHGVRFSASRLPFSSSGRLQGGLYHLPGHVSSQYLSGLLFALPLAEQDSEIVLTSPVQAPGYVEMTLASLKQFGIIIESGENNFRVAGRQKYRSPGQLLLEGDWSNAACFLAAGALAGPVRLRGLNSTSCQPDKNILPILQAFGARVEQQGDAVTISRRELRGQEIDVAAVADLAPLLAVLGALSSGCTKLSNAARLSFKESDRLQSTAALLSSLGARVMEMRDALVIDGQAELRGGVVRSHGDHRIVMAAALAACACRNDVIISGAEAVNKSYPSFFQDYQVLGGQTHQVHLG